MGAACSSSNAAEATPPAATKPTQPEQDKQTDSLPPAAVELKPQTKQSNTNENGHAAPIAEQPAQQQVSLLSNIQAPQDNKPWKLRVLEGVPSDIRAEYDFGKTPNGEVLGKGQFGVVRKAYRRSDQTPVAVKSIAKRKLVDDESIEDVRKEVSILHHLVGHSALPTIYGVFEDKQYVHIVMQLATGGELFERIVERKHYSEKDAAAAFRVMVDVIMHCHNMGVMHRDLKPENFLLADSSPDAQVICADFGLSTFFAEGEKFDDFVGSAYYCAPELIECSYSKEADMWSLGIILYILLSGGPPFTGRSEDAIFKSILTDKPDLEHAKPWPSISSEAKDLVKRLLERDPAKRMTAKGVLNDPWVKSDGVASDAPIQYEVLSRIQNFAKHNRLKKEALKIIAGMLPDLEVEGLREMFKSFDVDKSGCISVQELKSALLSKGCEVHEENICHLINGTDLNSNAKIDYEEFIAATMHESKLSKEELVYQAFQVLDHDQSGYIDAHEMMNVLSKHAAGASQADLEEILEQVDKNKDGRIDYEEFQIMLNQKEHLPKEPSLRDGLRTSLNQRA